MPLVLKDRVKETTSTTGTGSLTLLGASTGYQTFSTAIGNGNTTYYTIQSYNGSEWEVGIGTVSAGTLSRDTVLSSSTGAKVSFSAGTKDVFCTYPAGKSVYTDASNYVSGYTIENSTIGATTASTGRFSDLTDTGLTSGRVTYASTGGNLVDSANLTFNGTTLTTTAVVTPSVTASSTDLTLSAISTGAVKFNTANGTGMTVVNPASTVANYWEVAPAVSGVGIGLYARGTDASVAMNYLSKGSFGHFFSTGGTYMPQAVVSHTASAVNYVQVTGNATTNAPSITSQGSDSSVAMVISSKGAGNISFWSYGSANRQFVINGANASVNYHQVAGSVATQAPIYSVGGTDTNISMAFQPKGTGAIDLAAGSSGVNISNGGTVTSITRSASGSNYTSIPTTTISAPTTAGGVQAVAYSVIQNGAGTTVASGGTGYTVNDVITMVGGTLQSGSAGTFTVTAVSGGVITAVTPNNFGQYNAIPTNPVSVTGGTGSGATLNVAYIYGYAVLTNNGSGYIEQPSVTITGGGGSGAAAYATVGSGTIVKALGNNINFNTPNSQVLSIVDKNSGGNYPTNTNPAFTMVPSQNAFGASYLGMLTGGYFATNNTGSGSFVFATGILPPLNGNGGSAQFQIAHTASAVNYVQVTGGATGSQATISAQGSDANVGLIYTSKGTSSLQFRTNSSTQTQLFITHTANAVNYASITGSAAGSAPIFSVGGSDTNIDLSLTTKGTGAVRLNTGGGEQFRATNTASAVNYVQVTGGATGGGVTIIPAGSDANILLALNSKGTNPIQCFTNGSRQFQVSNTTSAVNFLQVTGSIASSAPVLSAQGTDTNIDLTLTPKGTGGVAINSAIKLGAGASAGTSGQVLTSAGAGASPTWSTVSGSGGMTLLGTITPTAVNSVSLGSLTLTSYKSLYIVFNGIGGAGTGNKVLFVSSNNQQSGGGASFSGSSTACSGTAWLDLGTGAIGGGISENTVTSGTSTFKIGGLTNVATSTTTLYFRYSSTDNFAAIGSIVIYGVS